VRSVDAVVIGGGPAGLAAATWLARYRRSVLVVDSGEYRNRWVKEAHGYLAHHVVRPLDFLAACRRDLLGYDEVTLRTGRARDVTGVCDAFAVTLDGDETVHGRRVVLATGVEDVFPDVAGFFDHYGTSVFHCPVCDGYEARGRDVVVFGWGAHVTGFALTMLTWAATVTVVTDGHDFEGDTGDEVALRAEGVAVVEDVAAELVGRRGDLRSVRLSSGVELPCQMAFFSIAHRPRTELAASLSCELGEAECVQVDGEGRTSVPGVFAAGDLVPGLQLVQVAAGKGAVAGVGCARSLLTLPNRGA
jgi:thioredoxin reductase